MELNVLKKIGVLAKFFGKNANFKLFFNNKNFFLRNNFNYKFIPGFSLLGSLKLN
jgi:hypothetical protein